MPLPQDPPKPDEATADQANGSQEKNNPYFDSNSEKIPDEEYLENQGYRSLKEKKPLPSVRFILPLLLVGIVLVIIMAVWFRGKPQRPPVNLVNHELQDRVTALEKQLMELNGIEERLQTLERDGQSYLQAVEKLNRMETSLSQRMDQLSKTLSVAPPKPAAARPSEKQTAQKTVKQANAVTHVVKSGDTLYSISRHYQVSIDQLRSDNNLGKKSTLHPGQKIIVNPPRSN
ncbi:MAG: LysM peptidoglycan-binding domain-containing protein [Desulfobacterales bacterium]